MVWVYEDMEVWYGVLQYDIMMLYIYIYIYIYRCHCVCLWMYGIGYCSRTLSLQDQGTFTVLTRPMNQSLGEKYPNKGTSKYK